MNTCAAPAFRSARVHLFAVQAPRHKVAAQTSFEGAPGRVAVQRPVDLPGPQLPRRLLKSVGSSALNIAAVLRCERQSFFGYTTTYQVSGAGSGRRIRPGPGQWRSRRARRRGHRSQDRSQSSSDRRNARPRSKAVEATERRRRIAAGASKSGRNRNRFRSRISTGRVHQSRHERVDRPDDQLSCAESVGSVQDEAGPGWFGRVVRNAHFQGVAMSIAWKMVTRL